MREDLKSSLSRLGLKCSNFHYEEFEILSGIGVRKGLNRLLNRCGFGFFRTDVQQQQ